MIKNSIDKLIKKLINETTVYTKLDQFQKMNIQGYAQLQSLIAKFQNEMRMHKKAFDKYPKFKQVVRKTLNNIINKYLGDK